MWTEQDRKHAKWSAVFWVLFFLILINLVGCSTLGAAWNYGAAANDKALASAEAVLCKGASSGAVLRRYGLNTERARYRRGLCGLEKEAQ